MKRMTVILLVVAVTAPAAPAAEPAKTAPKVLGGEMGPAWGKEVNGLRAGLSPDKRKFEAGDRDRVKLVLHLRNNGKEKVVLPRAGAEHGWSWQFNLVGGGKAFNPRWDDDASGQRAPPANVVLDPGVTKNVKAGFLQRSFMKGYHDFCPLVPGKYRITASYETRKAPAAVAKGDWNGKLTTGAVEIEIAGRGDAWDTLATANAPTLIILLGDKDKQLRAAATAFLAEKGKAALPALSKGLTDEHASVRAGCALILGRLRKDAEPAVAALAKALTDTDPHVQVKAAEALGWIGKGAKAAIPALLRAVRDDRSKAHPNVRPAAAMALERVGEATPDIVAALAELLKNKMFQADANNYAGVAYALGRMGPKAKVAVPTLVELLQDKSNRERYYVLRAVQGIGPGARAAVPELIRLLEDQKESMKLRAEAASTLARIGAAAKEAIPALERVHNKYRSAPQNEPKARQLADAAKSAAEQIRKAKPSKR